MAEAARQIIGSLSEFDPDKEKWENYKKRLDSWMRINKIKAEEKADVLLALVGPKAFELLVALCTPGEPSAKTYDQLTELLRKHYLSGTNELSESYAFDTRTQNENESVADYIVALKKLSIHSGFGAEEQVQKRLRNRLVAGVRAESIKNRLLSEGATLTWQKAMEISMSMDAAQQNSKMMRPMQTQEINRVQSNRGARSYRSRGKPKQHRRCYRCDGDHAGQCPFINEKCFKCNRVGHIAKACKTSQNNSQSQDHGSRQSSRGFGRGRGRGHNKFHDKGRTNCVESVNTEEEVSYASLYEVKQTASKEIKVNACVNDQDLTFTVDTASAVSIVGECFYHEHLRDQPLDEPEINLKSYTGHKVDLLGQVQVKVNYNKQEKTLPLVVAKGERTALFGRNWMKEIRLDWENIFHVSVSSLQDMLQKYSSVFKAEIGEMKHFEARIELKPDSSPKFHKTRSVPYALTDGVKQELDRLEKIGVLQKIEKSDWASPIVVVPKADGKLRLCGDYKVSINSEVVDQPYPLPTAEDIFATLAGGCSFSKIDLSNAYLQVRVENKSRKYLTINTVKGLYEVMRLPYGIKTAPHIFQSIMDQVLQGIPGVCCYIDDILITAPTDEEHLRRLDIVLQRLDKYNICAKREKCSFMTPEVKYLGHILNKEGRHPLPEKVKAVQEAKEPENVSGLRTFLGMVNYYSGFIKNLSTLLAPLNNLLRDEVPWKWCTECKKAFLKVKRALSSDNILIHYDSKKNLILACDASPYGVGAVLSQLDSQGRERPIAYASRTLTKAENNYAQLEREALGIVFGVKKFHKYLYGRKFVLVSDNKPLITIFGPKTGIPTLAALRLQRWALLLMMYNYDIKYKSSEEHGNADYLSRAAVEEAKADLEAEINYFSHTDKLPVNANVISECTRKDRVLSRVLEYTWNGWPNHVEDEYLPYFNKRHELSCDQGCLLWGMRVIIPIKLQARLLEELHHEHLGVVRMKALARSYLWFPGLDQAIETLVKGCKTCLSLKNDPPPSPLYPWKYTERPWDRVHIDFAEYKSEMFLVAVDAYSKWMEVVLMRSTTAEKTVEVLRQLFSNYGLPREIVSDNGPQFIAEQFQYFMRMNGVKHTLTAPYHPASNGAAERAVQTLKNALKKHSLDAQPGVSTEQKLCSFLLTYRTTPHSLTGVSPAELFMRRQLRTRLTLIKPDFKAKVEQKQEKMKNYRDLHVPKLREFVKNERVRVKNCRGGEVKYVPGTIVYRQGPVQYLVRVARNIRYVHVDHILKSGESPNDHNDEGEFEKPGIDPIFIPSSSNEQNRPVIDGTTDRDTIGLQTEPRVPDVEMAPNEPPPQVPERRTSGRISKRPVKLDDYVLNG